MCLAVHMLITMHEPSVGEEVCPKCHRNQMSDGLHELTHQVFGSGGFLVNFLFLFSMGFIAFSLVAKAPRQ